MELRQIAARVVSAINSLNPAILNRQNSNSPPPIASLLVFY